jgi:hypothetical protein
MASKSTVSTAASRSSGAAQQKAPPEAKVAKSSAAASIVGSQRSSTARSSRGRGRGGRGVRGGTPAVSRVSAAKPLGHVQVCGLCQCTSFEKGTAFWGATDYAAVHGVRTLCAKDNACKRCRHMHIDAFNFMEWSDLCEKNIDNPEVQEQVRQAFASAECQHPRDKGFSEAEVLSRDFSGIRLQEYCKVGTEDALRKAVGVYRLSKKSLDQLPRVACSENADDTMYILRDDEKGKDGLKDAIMYRDVSLGKNAFRMRASSHLFEDQPDEMINKCDEGESKTLKRKMEVELSQTARLKSLGEFTTIVRKAGGIELEYDEEGNEVPISATKQPLSESKRQRLPLDFGAADAAERGNSDAGASASTAAPGPSRRPSGFPLGDQGSMQRAGSSAVLDAQDCGEAEVGPKDSASQVGSADEDQEDDADHDDSTAAAASNPGLSNTIE